ncbi:MAG: Uma2 family endonuclease [Thermostichus sp. BF3_bins_97]
MVQSVTTPLTLEEFFESVPDNGRFELRNGVVVEMQPTGTHEQVAGFLAQQLAVAIHTSALPYLIPRQAILKAVDSDLSGYNPDVVVLKKEALKTEPLWIKRSTIVGGKTVVLAIEVVSTNWQDDYLLKQGEYERLGIPEYWIVDYLGLGGKRLIGDPKQPTLAICDLVEGEYQMRLLRAQDPLVSRAFPSLNLTVEQIFAAGQDHF